jgi:hypothetical protein
MCIASNLLPQVVLNFLLVITVCLCYAIELSQTIMVTSDAFVWFVYGWGNLDSISELNVNWFDVPIIVGMVSMIVQCFFAWRIWKFGQSKLSSFLAGFVVFVSNIILDFPCSSHSKHIMLRCVFFFF